MKIHKKRGPYTDTIYSTEMITFSSRIWYWDSLNDEIVYEWSTVHSYCSAYWIPVIFFPSKEFIFFIYLRIRMLINIGPGFFKMDKSQIYRTIHREIFSLRMHRLQNRDSPQDILTEISISVSFLAWIYM